MPSLAMRASAYCEMNCARPRTANSRMTAAGMAHSGSWPRVKPRSSSGFSMAAISGSVTAAMRAQTRPSAHQWREPPNQVMSRASRRVRGGRADSAAGEGCMAAHSKMAPCCRTAPAHTRFVTAGASQCVPCGLVSSGQETKFPESSPNRMKKQLQEISPTPSSSFSVRRTLIAALAASPLAPAFAQFRVEVSGVGLTQLPIALVAFQGRGRLAAEDLGHRAGRPRTQRPVPRRRCQRAVARRRLAARPEPVAPAHGRFAGGGQRDAGWPTAASTCGSASGTWCAGRTWAARATPCRRATCASRRTASPTTSTKNSPARKASSRPASPT